MLSLRWAGSLCGIVSGKQKRGRPSALASRPGAALPVTKIFVDGSMCIALFYSRCSYCIVHARTAHRGRGTVPT